MDDARTRTLSATEQLSGKAQGALERVIARFREGDLSPLVAVARLSLDPAAPAARWSFGNRVLAYSQTGAVDCRGFRQWQAAGRQVKKGASAAYILRPKTIRRETEGEEPAVIVVGFAGVAVFPLDATEPVPGAEITAAPYTPPTLPPLHEVAARLGVAVHWLPVAPDRLGDYRHVAGAIRVGTHDPAVFFHELAHAAHYRVCPEMVPGEETERKEAVAELTATVLMELYQLGDRSGNAWRYIAHYHLDPLVALCRALDEVGKVLACLLAPVGEEGPPMHV